MTANGSVINRLKTSHFRLLRGDKEYLYNEKGQKILDFQCGANGHILGYNSAVIEKAIINQIHKGFFTQSNEFINKEKNELIHRLCQHIGFYGKNHRINGTATYFNSATEANQCAIQTASKRYNTLCERHYNEIICVNVVEHNISNRTNDDDQENNMLNKNAKNKIGIKYANYDHLSSVENLITEHTSAVMIKPINLEQNFIICDKEYMQELRKLCSYHKIGLIIDETNISIGYSGKMFIFQNYDIKPDIITLSTGLSSGLPMAICVSSKEFSNFISHNIGAKYCNNMSIAIANAIIQHITTEQFMLNISHYSKYLHTNMTEMKHRYNSIIKNIYVYGIIFAIQCHEYVNSQDLSALILSNGLSSVLAANNTICFLPPLNTSFNHFVLAINIISHSIEELILLLKY